MRVLQNSKLTVAEVPPFAPGKFIFYLWPIFLGLGLGFFIARGDWFYAAAIVIIIPVAPLFVKYPFLAVFIWLIIIPLLTFLPNQSNVFWVIHRLMIPAGLILAIVSQRFRTSSRHAIRLGSAELAMFMFLVLATISIFLVLQDESLPVRQLDAVMAAKSGSSLPQEDPYASSRVAIDRIVIPFCLYLLVRYTTLTRKDFTRLVILALFLACSQSVFGILTQISPGLLPSRLISSYGSARTYGTVGDPNTFTSILVFSMVLLFYAGMKREPGLIRSIFFLACGLSAVNIFLSFERGSWLGGIVVALGLLILYPRPMLKSMAILIVFVAIFGASVFSKQLTFASARINDQRTVNDRRVIYDSLFQMIERKPLFGWGYETVDRYSRQFYRQVGNAPILYKYITSHNTYLTIMAELGLVGFFFYVFPFFHWLVNSIRVWPRLPAVGFQSRSLLVILWLAVLHVFIVSNTMDMRFFPLSLGLWWLTLGFIANLISTYMEPNELGLLRPLSRNETLLSSAIADQ